MTENNMIKLHEIVYEGQQHWIRKVRDGFEVYRLGITCSTRCAQIGWEGDVGLQKAIKEVIKRDNNLLTTSVIRERIRYEKKMVL